MIRAFLFVTVRSFVNRILMRLRRLREPRYVVGLIAALVYFWFFVGRQAQHQPRLSAARPVILGAIVDGLSVVLLFALIIAWALPDDAGGLTFSEAEIQFLFTGPVSRRQLVLYKIIRTQPQVLLSAAITSFWGFRSAAKFPAAWLTFVVIGIYFRMVSIARARLALAGFGFFKRLAAVALAIAALCLTFAMQVQSSGQQITDGDSFFRAAAGPLHHAPLSWALFVPRLFPAAVIIPSWTTIATAGVAVLVLGVLFLQIATTLNVSFEEASLTASAKESEKIERKRTARTGQRVIFRRAPAPFRLPERATPELAIVWKNSIALVRVSVSWIALFAVLMSLAVFNSVLARNSAAQSGTAIGMLFFAAAFPIIACGIFKHDLRLDLPRLEILKSYPITGERLIAGEVAAPLSVISAVELLLLIMAFVLARFAHLSGRLAFFTTPQFIVVALLFAIPICALEIVLRNAVPVLFPGWSIRSPEEARGFEVMGQRIVVMGANVLLLCIALVPAAAVFFPVYLLAHHYFGGSPVVLAAGTVPASALIVTEVWLALRFLGAQFERLDVTSEFGTSVI